MNKLAYYKGYMDKEASTALQRAYWGGKIPLSAVAETSKKLKLKPRFLKPLGRGAEGVADLITHPDAGVAVQKAYDTKSYFYTPKMFKSKLDVYNKIEDPRMAKFYGQKGQMPITYHEYIPKNFGNNQALIPGIEVAINDIMKAKNLGKLHDLHEENVIGGKIIDFLPSQGVASLPSKRRRAMIKKMYRRDLMQAYLSLNPAERIKIAKQIRKANLIRARAKDRIDFLVMKYATRPSDNEVLRRAHQTTVR